MKKKIILSTLLALSISSINIESLNQVSAATMKNVTVDKGTIDKTMKWQSSVSYDYPNKEVGDFDSTIEYNEGGYKGVLRAKKIILTPQNRITDRTITLSDSWLDSTYRLRESDVPSPRFLAGATYTDPDTETRLVKDIYEYGRPVVEDTAQRRVYSASHGRAENYDRNRHDYLGYMSYNNKTYFADQFKFSDSPRKPTDYYGPDASEFGSDGWTIAEIAWDENSVQDSKNPKWANQTRVDNYMWKSDGSNGRVTYNRYRKGVYLNYYKTVTGYKYRQNYRGTFKLPDTATKWNVKVIYEGDVYGTNLTAKSIQITDMENKEVNELTKGKQYKARVSYQNTGETKVSKHNIELKENGVSLGVKTVNELDQGIERSVEFIFTANNTGTRTFTGFVDSSNEINETNESDNEVSINKGNRTVNLTAKSIQITDMSNKTVNELTKGKQYKAQILYQNTGDVNVPSHKIQLKENGINIGTITQNSLDVGQSRTSEITFTANNTGTRTFTGFVDSSNEIDETDESDNEVFINKNANIVNLTALKIQIFNSEDNEVNYLTKGKQYKGKVTYQNTGTVSVPSHKVSLEENGTEIGILSSESLLANSSRTVEFLFTATNSGDMLFTGIVDSRNEIDETNENDNEVSINKNSKVVNLTAKSISFVNMSNQEVSHLVKGEKYKAKVTYQNTGDTNIGSHKVNLQQDSKSIGTITVDKINNNEIKTLDYEFTANEAGNRNFKATVDSDNEVEETNENDNEVEKSIIINTRPKIELSYSPNEVFEGDNLTLTMKPTDEDNDLLNVELQIKENGKWKNIYSKKDNKTGSVLTHLINKVNKGTYEFRAIVTDQLGDTGQDMVTVSISELRITGKVDHTDEWKRIHNNLGHIPNQFYSGEKFILSAQVTNYPIEYVTANFRGLQSNNVELVINQELNNTKHPLYTGEIFDPSMSDSVTKLKNGTVNFVFTAKWKNGVIKQYTVPIQIIDNVYGAFDFHRTN